MVFDHETGRLQPPPDGTDYVLQNVPDLLHGTRGLHAVVIRVKLRQGNASPIQDTGQLVSGSPGIIDHRGIAGRRVADVRNVSRALVYMAAVDPLLPGLGIAPLRGLRGGKRTPRNHARRTAHVRQDMQAARGFKHRVQIPRLACSEEAVYRTRQIKPGKDGAVAAGSVQGGLLICASAYRASQTMPFTQ